MNKKRFLFSGVALSLKLTMVVLLMLSIVACQTGTSLSKDTPATQEVKEKENPYAKAEITTKVIPAANNT